MSRGKWMVALCFFPAAPVITSVNSSVNTTSKEATLDCYAHASPSPLVTWRLTEDIPST